MFPHPSKGRITSLCLYVAAIASLYAGVLAPIVLLLVGGVLYLYKIVYTEVVEAFPLNGGAYNCLLNSTSKLTASSAACMTILSYIATAGILVERERKKNKALFQAGSLAAVGRAVSDVAYEVKAPLMAIGGFANQVSRALDPEDPKQKKLRVVVRETARLESMVREMWDFGRPIEIQRAETNLNDLVGEVLQPSNPVAERCQVKSKMDLDPSLPPVSMDTQKFKQMLMNLTVNALEASPPGELVILKTTKGSGRANLHVIDRGTGIDTEDEDKIFDPFFSKKKGGTGLGLPIVKKIVEAHEGEISFHGNAEGGITFTVKLPLR